MKISQHNQMVKHITDPRDRKSPEERAKIIRTRTVEDAKRVATKRKEYGLPDMQKHTIDMLNKFEDGPDIKEEDLFVQAIRNSSTPVSGYIGGATPSDRPTRAEEKASMKQLEKYATQPDSRGVYKAAVEQNKKEVAAAEAAYKKSQKYPTEATPEMMGALAYNMEKTRQMTGGDGRYDKAIIKKKKIKPITPYPEVKFNNYEPYIPAVPSPEFLEQERNFKIILKQSEDNKKSKAVGGIAGLLGEFK